MSNYDPINPIMSNYDPINPRKCLPIDSCSRMSDPYFP